MAPKRRKRARRKALMVIGPSIAYIPLTRGQFACVDADMEHVLQRYSWQARNGTRPGTFYAATGMRYSDGSGRILKMQTFIFGAKEGYVVDHIDPSRSLDNRKANLRFATQAQNCFNQRRNLSSKTGFKGVSWFAARRKFRAAIGYGGKSHFIGYFDDPKKAHEAYMAAATEHHRDFARFE